LIQINYVGYQTFPSRSYTFGVPASYSFRSKAVSVSRTQERPQTKAAATNRALAHSTCFSASATEACISLEMLTGRVDLLRYFFG